MNKKIIKTPFFLISKEKLDENIACFSDALNTYFPKYIFGYSVKTNSLPWLLSYLNSKKLYAEVVSDEEYNLAIKCGYMGNHIIFNGPIKGDSTFKYAIENGSYINLDSKNDLCLLNKYKSSCPERIGFRININTSIFDGKDIGYEEDGFRFGYSSETGELEDAIELFESIYGNRKFGLHLHCNSITRSKNVYIAISKYAKKIIKKHNIDPSFIDIGGGFFGGVPGKETAGEYFECVRKELSETINLSEVELIIEPGSAIVGSVVELHTSVIDIKDTFASRIVTTDGSRIHIDPLWQKKGYLYHTDVSDERDLLAKQIITGYTCMDHDRIMTICDKPEVLVGDRIIYQRVGAYSMTFGGPFIRYYPEVYIEDEKLGKIIKVREKFDVDTYFSLQSCED